MKILAVVESMANFEMIESNLASYVYSPDESKKPWWWSSWALRMKLLNEIAFKSFALTLKKAKSRKDKDGQLGSYTVRSKLEI